MTRKFKASIGDNVRIRHSKLSDLTPLTFSGLRYAAGCNNITPEDLMGQVFEVLQRDSGDYSLLVKNTVGRQRKFWVKDSDIVVCEPVLVPNFPSFL